MPADHLQLIAHSSNPFNAEPPLAQLRAHAITPQSGFYVRSHGNVPVLDPAAYRLHVKGLVTTALTLSMTDLKTRFPARTITATLQCAGNRRADLRAVRPVSGDPWAAGAIGNATWTGASLAEVLQTAGLGSANPLHVAFDCADQCTVNGASFQFGISIPAAKALQPEILLAYAMNGEPLLPAHGAPLRLIVPGFAGVRSPKWLQTITVQSQESTNPMQAHDYKLFPSSVLQTDADPALGMTINTMPVTSAICEPALHAQLPPGPATVRGYAMASERQIVRVDVSSDGGRTWQQAVLEDNQQNPWSWTLWHATLDLEPGEQELAVRAWDAAGQTQPATPDEVWNVKGYLSTAWHRVPVTVNDAVTTGTSVNFPAW